MLVAIKDFSTLSLHILVGGSEHLVWCTLLFVSLIGCASCIVWYVHMGRMIWRLNLVVYLLSLTVALMAEARERLACLEILGAMSRSL